MKFFIFLFFLSISRVSYSQEMCQIYCKIFDTALKIQNSLIEEYPDSIILPIEGVVIKSKIKRKKLNFYTDYKYYIDKNKVFYDKNSILIKNIDLYYKYKIDTIKFEHYFCENACKQSMVKSKIIDIEKYAKHEKYEDDRHAYIRFSDILYSESDNLIILNMIFEERFKKSRKNLTYWIFFLKKENDNQWRIFDISMDYNADS